MARITGNMYVCERCCNHVFVNESTALSEETKRAMKKINAQHCPEGERSPKGFNIWLPAGWKWHSDIGNLCPECAKKYNDLLTEFLEAKI